MKVIKYLVVFAAAIFTPQIIAMNALKNKQMSIAAAEPVPIATSPSRPLSPAEQLQIKKHEELTKEITRVTRAREAEEKEEEAAMTPAQLAVLKEIGARSLIIIFDPKNVEGYTRGCQTLRTMWTRLIAALKDTDSNTPIIASLNLCKNIAKCQSEKFLLSKWDAYTNWDDNSLIVFIPKKSIYIGIANKYSGPQNIIKGSDVTAQELLLGIKVDHLQKVPDIASITTSYYKLYDFPDSLSPSLEKILVSHADFRRSTRHDYFALKHSDNRYLNRWDIYLAGHGGGSKIAAVEREDFGSLLDFLNTKINTRSLFYDTCYAGGKNLKEPYQYEVEKGIKEVNNELEKEIREKNLNFTIISATTFYAVTKTPSQPTQYASQSTINPIPIPSAARVDFKNYFSQLNAYFADFDQDLIKALKENQTKEEMIRNIKDALKTRLSLAAVVQNVSEWHKTFDPAKYDWLNIPTVRFPNTEWFSITEIDDTPLNTPINQGTRTFNVNNNMIMRIINSAKNDNEKNITIPRVTSTPYIFLEARYIPIPLKIEGYLVPLIIPLEHNKNYFFEEINAPNCFLDPYNELTAMLSELQHKMSDVTAKFYIKKLTIKLNPSTVGDKKLAGPPAQLFELKNVILDPSDPISRMTFEYNNQRIEYLVATKTWLLSSDPDDLQNLRESFEYNRADILRESDLPESMKSEHPKPMLEIIPASRPGNRPKMIGHTPQEPQ